MKSDDWRDHTPGSWSAVTSRRARTVLLSVQGVDVPAMGKMTFTSEDQGIAVVESRSVVGQHQQFIDLVQLPVSASLLRGREHHRPRRVELRIESS